MTIHQGKLNYLFSPHKISDFHSAECVTMNTYVVTVNTSLNIPDFPPFFKLLF